MSGDGEFLAFFQWNSFECIRNLKGKNVCGLMWGWNEIMLVKHWWVGKPWADAQLVFKVWAWQRKGVFSRHDCIRFIFSLSSTTDCPIFPWSPLTEISSFGGGEGRHQRQAGEALPGGHCCGPSSTAARLSTSPGVFGASQHSAGFWAHDEWAGLRVWTHFPTSPTRDLAAHHAEQP